MAKGFGNMMRQAQQMQKKMAQIQQELESRTIDASAGGGMVKCTVSGKQEILSLTIDPACPMSHMALATSHDNQDHAGDALDEYRRAMELLAAQPPDQDVPHAGGISHGTLLGICREHIARLQGREYSRSETQG